MKKRMTLDKAVRRFGIDDDLLYAAIGRGLIPAKKKKKTTILTLNKKSRALLASLAASGENRELRIKSLRQRLKLQERIIAAKDETIASKESELEGIKEVYNNLLHLYNETKRVETSRPAAVEPKKETTPPEGYIMMTPQLFSTRMRDLGFSLEAIKERIVTGVIEGEMDLSSEGLLLEEDFFARFQKPSTYWDKRQKPKEQ